VLAILAGEMTTAEAARKAKVSEQSMSNWKRLFLESGRHVNTARVWHKEASADLSQRTRVPFRR
jgi:transposase